MKSTDFFGCHSSVRSCRLFWIFSNPSTFDKVGFLSVAWSGFYIYWKNKIENQLDWAKKWSQNAQCPRRTLSSLWVNYLLHWWIKFDNVLSWLFTRRFRVFTSFAENGQILLKIFVIPILLIFMYLVTLNQLANNQLNSSSNSTHHCGR